MITEDRPFGLYVHWPFCLSKCPYCDFNSHVHDGVDHEAWADALVRELDYYADMNPGRRLQSIFFGGGTPSLMMPKTVAAIIDRAQQRWNFSNDIEITLEANPTSVEADKFKAFRAAGINRVSIGIQALNDADLKFLGRTHSAAEGIAAIEIARKTFDRFSFDLIYARPDQKSDDWEKELAHAIGLANGHLSLYQLTIEPGTPFFTQHARGDFVIPNDIQAGVLYELTQGILNKAGYPAYEISNHAIPGQESRHNMIYWLYGDYVGIGPGAHGRLTLDGQGRVGTRAHRAPEIWLQRVEKDGHGAHPFEPINQEQQILESVMMGLRLRQGIDIPRLEQIAGKAVDQIFDLKKMEHLTNEGYVTRTEHAITATDSGRQRLNSLLGYLLA